jgi:acyl-CoA synthetase (AMP-forming)/AMP-acid ligase II
MYQEFVKIVANNKERYAVIQGGVSVSYLELKRMVECCAANLLSNSPSVRPRVAIISNDTIENTVVSLAVASIGGAVIPVNPNLKSNQIEKVLESSLANIVVCQKRIREPIDVVDFSALMAPNSSVVEANQAWLDDDDFLITLSSGSTGEPKPIAISQSQKLRRARQTIKLFNLNSEDVILSSSPFFHSLGQRLVFVALISGGTVVSLPKFSAEGWCQCVERSKVSFTMSVPTQIYSIFDYLNGDFTRINSLKHLVSSSAPIDQQFKRNLFDEAGIQFSEIYGATEVAVVSLLEYDMNRKSHTVGKICERVDVKIVDENGDESAVGLTGEITVKSDFSFAGYYDRNLGLKNDDEYFRTGDLGYLDEQNFLTFKGRKKDIIFCGGANVFPRDVESILMSSGLIRDCAVFPLSIHGYGEVVGVVCETRADDDFDKTEMKLRKICNQQLASYQRPIRYYFTLEIPRTGVGKIDKSAVIQRYASSDFELGKLVKGLIG